MDDRRNSEWSAKCETNWTLGAELRSYDIVEAPLNASQWDSTTGQRKVVKSERKDHDYIDVQLAGNCLNSHKTSRLSVKMNDASLLRSPERKKLISARGILIGRVKNISKLKKAMPRVKLVSPEVTSLPSNTGASRQALKNYCRTCAGLKMPLVDIFSESGMQMRLNQQMKFLVEINQHDSLSTRMCMDCICDLEMSYTFIMQIKKAQVKLESIHASSHTPSTNESRVSEDERLSQVSAKSAVTKNSGIAVLSRKPEVVKADVSLKLQKSSKPDLAAIKNEQQVRNAQSRKKIESQTEEESMLRQSNDNDSIEGIDPQLKLDSTEDVSETVYQCDTTFKAYINFEPPDDNNQAACSPAELKNDRDSAIAGTTKEVTTYSNILKRKIPVKRDFLGKLPTFARSGSKDTKKPKLNVENTLNITKEHEDGIKYVTIKGTEPNKLLLVKVRKVDKPEGNSKKDEKKKSMDSVPVDEILKKLEPFTSSTTTTATPKDKYFRAERSRERMIEEQIEEYKKKREKILGGAANLPNTPKFEDGPISFINPVKNVDPGVRIKDEPSEDINAIRQDVGSRNNDEELDCFDNARYGNIGGGYLSRSAKLKREWEAVEKKKESLQRELDESYTEENFKKLARIHGEKEKSLQDFQDYLKQRKIVITRLKDEDIISVYEDRNNTYLKKNRPDLIEESTPSDYIEKQNYLECDYCPESFPHREVLEEHLKSHDYRLMYYCEDCQAEFSTLKSERSHNVTCTKKLICKYCDLPLDSKGKKKQHEQRHVDSIYGQLCDVCGKKFRHRGILDQHFKTQHMTWGKIYPCPKCTKKFPSKQKLSLHRKSVHTTLRTFPCEDCGADLKNSTSFRHHRKHKHQPTGNKRECPVCKKLVLFYNLSTHMSTHKDYTIKCPHCDKMFKSSSTLKQHVRIHEDQRQYRCDTCEVGFNRRDRLRLHMRVHQKTDSRSLKECSCQICSETFPNVSMLAIHRNRVHKDGRQYSCRICNRSMFSTRSLEWHMSHFHNETLPGGVREESESAPEKKRVACVHCDETFETDTILRTHVKNTHMEKDPTKCLDCDLTFTPDDRLRHHMMVAHNRLEGTLSCSHCSKRFVSPLRLRNHMISHSEDRPFRCEICGFNLKSKCQLIKHHENRHSDERPLQCRYCPWRCKQLSALVCHERTHTNERPYSCSVCRQRFKYSGDKNKHERRHESLGGSGFKRIVAGRNLKPPKISLEETSISEQEHNEHENDKNEEQIAEEQAYNEEQ